MGRGSVEEKTEDEYAGFPLNLAYSLASFVFPRDGFAVGASDFQAVYRLRMAFFRESLRGRQLLISGDHESGPDELASLPPWTGHVHPRAADVHVAADVEAGVRVPCDGADESELAPVRSLDLMQLVAEPGAVKHHAKAEAVSERVGGSDGRWVLDSGAEPVSDEPALGIQGVLRGGSAGSALGEAGASEEREDEEARGCGSVA